MKLTFETLFNEPLIVTAVVDRIQALQKDPVFWKRYLDFEQTSSRTFKTYYGTQTGVVMGSVIDKNAQKPVRERKTIGSGFGEVASLGDKFQLDNDRLDMLRQLIDQYNAKSMGTTINTIVDYIIDDVRQATLAPHKRMDKFVGDLRSTGAASVTLADNPRGIELIETILPVCKLAPDATDVKNFITYLQQKVQQLRGSLGSFAVMEMSYKTFTTRILASTEFRNTYRMILSDAEVAMAGGLITVDMANKVLTGIGLPPIRVVEDYVDMPDGTSVNTFRDDKVTLLPTDKIGKMRWHVPYEITDPVPNKVYTNLEGGQFISSLRTDEGRFLEYGCEWIPEFTMPNRLAIVDLDGLPVNGTDTDNTPEG